MTRTLLVVLVLVLTFGVVSSEAGRIELAGDTEGLTCNIVDIAAGGVKVHIFLYDVVSVGAIQFAAPVPTCWEGATWVGDVSNYLNIGESQDHLGGGLSVAFGECLDGPIYVGYMAFIVQGKGEKCCELPIVKAQNDGYPQIDGPIIVVCPDDPNDIENYRVVAVTASAVINSDGACGCSPVVPVNETTWGRLKALYN